MATISARFGDSPLVFHCSSVWETLLGRVWGTLFGRYRISLVPGGDYRWERHESREFEGSGKLLLTWSRDKKLTFFLHADPSFYPIMVDVSWRWKGKQYHKSVALYEGDMPFDEIEDADLFEYDRENPTYSYSFNLRSNGKLEIWKVENFDSTDIEMSKAMRIMEKAKD